MSVTYTATLTVREETVLYLAGLLRGERLRRGTRAGNRALGCFKQAVLVIRWFCDGTRVAQLAIDNAISKSTAYDYLDEDIDVLATTRPGCSRRCWRRRWPATPTSTSTGRSSRPTAAVPPDRPRAWTRGFAPPSRSRSFPAGGKVGLDLVNADLAGRAVCGPSVACGSGRSGARRRVRTEYLPLSI